jgi:hypothetical protein
VAIRGAAAALLFLSFLSACNGASEEHAEETVFRVGAVGLAPLVPGPDARGSSAAAMDLVYDTAAAHVEEMRSEGTRVLLKRRTDSRYTAEQLAASLRYQGLVSARALGADTIEAVFREEATARLFTDPDHVIFDVGPYRIESQRPGRTVLQRRSRSAIDAIEIVEVSGSDEWRKLMARELDVLSASPSMYREQFAGMESVRVLDIPAVSSAALYFHVSDPALVDANVRRRIAGGLNRPAIARIVCGDPSCAAAGVASSPAEDVALPAKLSLLVVEGDSTMLLAAMVLRHQFDRLHIALAVEALSVESFLGRIDGGKYQLVLGPLPNGERRFGRFLSPGPDNPSMTGFSHQEYDAAVKRGDFEGAQSILDREVPASVLYQLRTFAAIDARYCGKVTPSPLSWRWMASLHPCKNGEGEGAKTP